MRNTHQSSNSLLAHNARSAGKRCSFRGQTMFVWGANDVRLGGKRCSARAHGPGSGPWARLGPMGPAWVYGPGLGPYGPKMQIRNYQNPYPGGFQGFRSVRIDPSRQVSMTAARAGLSSFTWTRKRQKNIKKHKRYPKTTPTHPQKYIPYIFPIFPRCGAALQGCLRKFSTDN